MTIFKHELKRDKLSLIIWAAVISFILTLSILMYPEMETQMQEISSSFSEMGSFSTAFGIDNLDLGDFMNYFAVECGNSFGLGSAFFAALIGIAALAKEEKENTADFLLSHPISRNRLLTEKFLAMLTKIFILNIIIIAVCFLSSLIIGEALNLKLSALIFAAFFIMQIEIASITFGLSAFIKNGGIGMGIGISVVFYFFNIISNITDKVRFLKYLTPFAYSDATAIISSNSMNVKYLSVGVIITILFVILGYIKYNKKDLA